jgi:hypothetical protein
MLHGHLQMAVFSVFLFEEFLLISVESRKDLSSKRLILLYRLGSE